MSHDPVFVPGVWGPYRDSIIPDFWMAEGGQSATGELLKHVLETHPAHQQAQNQAESFNTNIYDFLNEHLRDMKQSKGVPSIAHLGKHFFFYGDLFGNRSPIADPNMSGSVVGLSSDKSLDGMALYYYGTMEFIALQTLQIITEHEQSWSQDLFHLHVRQSMSERYLDVVDGYSLRHAGGNPQICLRCCLSRRRHARSKGCKC